MVILRLNKLACLEEVCINIFCCCLCYVMEISAGMLEEQVLEERYTDLNEEEDTRMEDIREEHWRKFDEILAGGVIYCYDD